MEKDPLEFFWQWNPIVCGIVVAIGSPGLVYVIELGRSLFSEGRPPYGLAIFRWTTVYIGDLMFLAPLIAVMALYYNRVEVSESFFTNRGFFALCALMGLFYSAGFILLEEVTRVYPQKDLGQIINRTYHFFFVIWMVYMLIGALRAPFYGQEMGLVAVALVLFALYLVTQGIDNLRPDLNFVWRAVQQAYPEQTKTP